MIQDAMRYRFDDVTMDRDRRGLFRGGEAIHLSPRAYRLLELLLDRRPAVVPRQEILDALWPDVVVSDGSLAVLVNELRRALDDDAHAPRWIRTVPAFGYSLDGNVREENGPAPRMTHGLVWAGTTVVLAEGENLLGRDPASVVVIGHPSISRQHARVVVEGLEAFLEDLGSRNGTFVGTRRVESRAALFDGDEIHLGTATLTYRGPGFGSALPTMSRS